MSIAFISAVLPVVVLLIFIYRKDKYDKEPVGKLLWVFFLGCLSVIPAGIQEMFLDYMKPETPVLGSIYEGFVVAGFSEELWKLLLLYWAVWKSPEFDEYFDGIVYAAFLSLGFACVENVGYVMGTEDALSTALMRGILAVPAHFLFAVMMGYHFSLARFDLHHKWSHLWKALLYPLLMHGTYDTLLMVSSELHQENIVIPALFVIFIVFDVMMWRWGMKRIKRLQERSKEQGFDRQNPFEGFTWNF